MRKIAASVLVLCTWYFVLFFSSCQKEITIDLPQQPLGGHAFTMLAGVAETPSAFVPGSPSHKWMAMRTGGDTTLEDLSRRVRISPEFAQKVYDIVSPGTTIVVTDAAALRSSPSVHAILLMEAVSK